MDKSENFTDVAGMIVETLTYYPAEKAALVAGFNTNGDIKSKINSKLTPSSTFPLDGLYIRTEFLGYAFFPHFTSRGNDIAQLKNLADDVPGLIAATSTQATVAGFDTDGWTKTALTIPPTTQPPGFADSDRRGIYLRTSWPDFAFLCGYDSPGNDIGTPIKGTVEQMIVAARADSRIVAFSTDGNMKSAVAKDPVQLSRPDKLSLSGVYVKIPAVPDLKTFSTLPPARDGSTSPIGPVPISTDSTTTVPESTNLTVPPPAPEHANLPSSIPESITLTSPNPDTTLHETASLVTAPDLELTTLALTDPPFGEGEFNGYLFAFKATAFIWGTYFIKDSTVRLNYTSAVATQSAEIFQLTQQAAAANPANARTIWMQGASQAHSMRNLLLQQTRDQTTPLGRAFAQSIKPNGKPYLFYLNLNAQKKFSTPFQQLTDAQAATVAGDTIRSAGRANLNITNIMRGVRVSGQALVLVGCVTSMYSVVVEDDWRLEMAKQAGSWYGAIAAGQAGSGIGAIFGPAGAVLGGLAGGCAGSFTGIVVPNLAKWFFGGSSSLSAVELLGDMHDAAHAAVTEIMKTSGANFHVHRVHGVHLSLGSSDEADLRNHAMTMVSTSSEENLTEGSSEEVRLFCSTLNETDLSLPQVLATLVWVAKGENTLPTNAAHPGDLVILMDYLSVNLPTTK